MIDKPEVLEQDNIIVRDIGKGDIERIFNNCYLLDEEDNIENENEELLELLKEEE